MAVMETLNKNEIRLGVAANIRDEFEHSVAKKLAELIGEQSENKGLGISNLGRHDFSNYKDIKIVDVQFIGPAFPANLLTVGLITVNGKLNLCLRYNEGEIKTDTVKEIYEKALVLLHTFFIIL